MIIYGTALLAVCHLLGIFLGDLLGPGARRQDQRRRRRHRDAAADLRAHLHAEARTCCPSSPSSASSTGARCTSRWWSRWRRSRTWSSALRGGPVALLSAIGAAAVCAVRHRGHQSHRAPGRRSRAGARRCTTTPCWPKRSDTMMEILEKAAAQNGLVTAFAIVGLDRCWCRGRSRKRLTFGRVHGSAIAIVIGLALAYWGGIADRRPQGPGRHVAVRRHRPDGRRDAARLRDRRDRLRSAGHRGAQGRDDRRGRAAARHGAAVHRRRGASPGASATRTRSA